MTQEHTINTIRAALRQMSAGDLTEAATHFLAALGYRSDRLLDGQTGTVDYFIANFKADNTDTRSEQDFRDSVSEARILFQYTESEIAETGQRMLLEAEGFSEGNSRSFIFAAVELNGSSYPRGRYAAFTREINKRFNRVPAAVLFRTSNGKVTLAFVNRRPSKIRDDRQVLGSVSLIREIDPANPHRAHLDILAELSLPERLRWMDGHGQPHNFDGLLAAWLAALDTEELNKKFYRELFTWFERAVQTAKFPDQEKVTLTAEEHVIRLITRLMFVWFIKEKGLVAEDLFIENQVSQLLKDYDPDGGDSYYRAVLQNLFFATLNTEIGDRRFSGGGNPSHRVFSLYRYRDQMAAPQDLTALFDRSPFINGGLFDCLDSEAATGYGGYRIDCFSDVHYGMLSIPNRLFFSQDQASPGLITLFNRYKFTVEENTPAEREVALDPELLGKVFENLLAAFNPETRENVRKQTGSYYTPRPVVDYMVDEALAAALAQKVTAQNVASPPSPPSDSPSFPREPESISDRLRSLLDYDLADADTLFTPAEKTAIVRAIAETRALDPAVGSGAFPMGILHKLTLALRRLDPGNQLWRELQREIATKRAADAFGTDDSAARERELEEISRTFDQYRDSDFGRKLYLIQNGIYGVDLQPVATQIAKLRFFISLAIEQQPNADPADNYGIRPLPNLETRFVAADTLLALGGLNRELVSPQTEDLQRQLNANRERHFHANTRALKKHHRERDGELRQQLADSLAASGLDADHAARVAAWDPYDQNARADWFDPQYMFGVTDGFDVVIGNPPYVQLQANGGRLANYYKDAGYRTFARSGDLYQLFYERGLQLLRPGKGLLAYISSNSWLRAEYGKATRRWVAENHTPLILLELGKDVFDAIVDSCIFMSRQGKSGETGRAVDTDRLADKRFPPAAEDWVELRIVGDKPWSAMSMVGRSAMDKMDNVGTPLKDWDVRIFRGVTTGYNKAFVIDTETKETLIAADPKSAEIIKPLLRGRDIRQYRANWAGWWLIYSHTNVAEGDYPAVRNHLALHRENLSRRRGGANPKTKQVPYKWWQLQVDYYNSGTYLDFSKEKLFWMDMSPTGRFAYSDSPMFCNDKGFSITGESLKYLCAVLNSTLVTWYMRDNALTTGMGLIQWKRFAVERIPIPKISEEEQQPLVALVEEILAAKEANPQADTRPLEREIDRLVYQLYGLTEEENTAIERSLGLIHQTDEAEDAAFLKILEESQTEERVNREEVMQILESRDAS